MKILYSVQATGNGHISRAMEILPYIERYGQVDVFLSGANYTLELDAPVKYRSKGLCLFYTNSGGLNYLEMIRKFAPLRILREVRDLPVEKYDLVINDFESITALACAFKKVPSVNFGHQASFVSPKTPRPTHRDRMGEWILRNYARATKYIGLHFRQYDDFILPPVIKKEILQADPTDRGHITVYLSSYDDMTVGSYLAPLKDHRFEVFSKEVSSPVREGNILFLPVGRSAFNKSLIRCKAIITGAGFETPAEALYMGKKLLVLPIRGQYEQFCNAAALQKMGVPVLEALGPDFANTFSAWMADQKRPSLTLDHSTDSIVSYVMQHAGSQDKNMLDMLYPDCVFN
ncbi:MAG: glycosyltransferase family protein [Bacteroidota bacterium]|nr:glycosyltransferase family protein [Bacteroidota bacterium]MDP4215223.1 glycosyltransferase family protein [Bacteroidota bacterium]MDP4246179.1 glycosyltransferase family protein [Bacteroidota bacterium]MDP4252357.1 glycosyltransferase family protein [Bacteroidota bacterium]